MTARLAVIFAFLCTAAWGADGEFRIIYAGNLGVGSGEARARAVAEVREVTDDAAAAGLPSVVLLPGNLLAPDPVAVRRDVAALEAAGAMSPAAIGLGPNEMKWGEEYLRQRSPGPPLPWVSLTVTSDRLSVLPARVIEVGGVRIGVLGLTLAPGALPDRPLRMRLTAELTRLHRECDVLVLLGAFDARQAPLLAAAFPGADVVLGGVADVEDVGDGPVPLAPLRDVPYVGGLDIAVRDGRVAVWRGWVGDVREEG